MSKQIVFTEIKKGYAILTIKRDPVNSMNLDLWEQLDAAVKSLENDNSVRAVIFKSGLERPIFTAGNDILELYAPKSSKERYTKFWKLQNQFLANVYNSRLTTVAAINGACPAGGTCLSLVCDYRIATPDMSMGLNEVALGITVPEYWMKLLVKIVGQTHAEKIILFAQMVDAKKAIEINLVDQIVESREALLPAAEATVRQVINTKLVVEDSRYRTSHLQKHFASRVGKRMGR
ncbi:dodecenoyl-CoA isomerase [Terramyces sp. JEL0728]|nr:dodecenoyl-CoA isomerase [Terramyces sp. JEL0728]